MEEKIEFCREDKVLIYVTGVLDNLKQKGIIEGGGFKLGTIGIEAYKKLIKDGFVATDEEIKAAIDALQEDS